ncbi:MAG: YdjY domain-containing protein [Planctomycetota bacterium]|jgi:hypothetical protein
MIRPTAILSAALLAAVALVAAPFVATSWSAGPGGPGEKPADNAAPAAQPQAAVKLPHIELDMRARRITLEASVCLREGLLELLVCKVGSKEHESILHTPARPSDLHAAMLALGLAPGKGAQWVQFETDPPRAIPPRGATATIALQWTDADGKTHEAPASQWIRLAPGIEAARPEKWVFVGSDVLGGGTYWADTTGEIVSLSNFASSVIDVPFESSANNEELFYLADTEAIPPVGTTVKVVITPVAGGENAEHARATVHVDRFGRFWADGEAVTAESLMTWAEEFMERHAKGRVVIRSDGRTISQHIQQARDAARMAGVWDIVEVRSLLPRSPLPRTPEQAKAAVAQLRADLAENDDVIEDPHDDARQILQQIDRELNELARLRALWGEYAIHVRQAMKDYPANGPTDDPDETPNDPPDDNSNESDTEPSTEPDPKTDSRRPRP